MGDHAAGAPSGDGACGEVDQDGWPAGWAGRLVAGAPDVRVEAGVGCHAPG